MTLMATQKSGTRVPGVNGMGIRGEVSFLSFMHRRIRRCIIP